MFRNKNLKTNRFRKVSSGLSLIEAVVGLAIFAVLIAGVLGIYSALSYVVKLSRERVVVSTLADNYMEIVRNMPYSQIGTVNGNPSGPLADCPQSARPACPNALSRIFESAAYKIFYEVSFLDDPADQTAPADTAPNDYKQIKVHVLNVATSKITSFVTNIVPKDLEVSSGGVLKVKVMNFSGAPVADVDVHIENLILSPDIILDRHADDNGELLELNLPASVNGYHVVASKTGYSSDQTYPITVQNPNPINPDATIKVGEVTTVVLMIDSVSNLTIKTQNQYCQNLNGVNLNVAGSKLIGINPDVLKFNQNLTSSAGQIVLSNIEADTYTPTLLTGQPWIIRGTSPIQKIDVLPGTSQTFSMILGTNTTVNSLLVIVKDAGTGAALEGAAVHLRKGGSVPQDYYGATGGSVWVQNSWIGGAGEANWSPAVADHYFADDGNLDINSTPTGVRLKKITGRYVASGSLESSAFDTGTASTNFTTLTWGPTSQTSGTTLRFQIATNNDNATWDYKGPDGTPGTYYTVPGSNINSIHDNTRYVRYRVYLDTTDDKRTPVLTSVNNNYVSGCATPGQTIFSDLTAGNNYDLDVSLAGYQTAIINSLDINGNQPLEVLLSQ